MSALLFAVFPLVRPFFPLDVFSPTLAEVASVLLTWFSWVAAHLALRVAFAVLPLGLLAVGVAHVGDRMVERRAWRALVLAIVGIGFVMPAVGVEVRDAGLTLWVPLLPRPVRIVDGLLIAVGGFGSPAIAATSGALV